MNGWQQLACRLLGHSWRDLRVLAGTHAPLEQRCARCGQHRHLSGRTL